MSQGYSYMANDGDYQLQLHGARAARTFRSGYPGIINPRPSHRQVFIKPILATLASGLCIARGRISLHGCAMSSLVSMSSSVYLILLFDIMLRGLPELEFCNSDKISPRLIRIGHWHDAQISSYTAETASQLKTSRINVFID